MSRFLIPQRTNHLRAAAVGAMFMALYSPILGDITGTDVNAQQQITTTRFGYDANSNLTTITDAFDRVTTQSYDGLGRMTQQLLPAPAIGLAQPTINYAYDGLDQLSKVTDPRNLVTTYTVDGLGNQSALASPDTGATSMTFDLAGNIRTKTDARGKTTSYTYDTLNRVTSISYPTGTASVLEYDGGVSGTPADIGKLTKMSDESGDTRYVFDDLGRHSLKVQTTNGEGTATALSIKYAYGAEGSALGKLVSMTYPSGNRINYSHDANGRVNGLTLNPAAVDGSTNTGVTITLMSNIVYTPFGAVQSWEWGNHSAGQPNTVVRAFDLDGRMTSYPLGNPATNGLVRTVIYDAMNRITAMTHTGSGAANFDQTFGYDGLDRLTSHTSSNATLAYAYDASGNRTQVAYGGSTYASTTSTTSNRLASVTGPLPAKTNAFDAAGNLTSDGTVAYTYSDRGRLKRVVNEGATTDYLYNGRGERVAKIGAGVATGINYFAYDVNGQLLGEYGAGGALIQETAYLEGMPAIVLTSDGAAQYYVHSDHIDTPRVITRSTDNAIVWRWDAADPFGVQQPLESPVGLPAFTYNPRFPGQLFDKESNNHYNYFRDYDPQTGRYVQSDPIGLAGGINTYAYVGANPISLTDPQGLNPGTAFGAGLGTIVFPGPGTIVGGTVGTIVFVWVGGKIVAAVSKDGESASDAPYAGETPDDRPGNFRPGSGDERGDLININDGSIWSPERAGDRAHGGSRWKRWPGKRDKDRNRNRESVRPDGTCR